MRIFEGHQVRVAVIHNLSSGGAHRRLTEQAARLSADVVEVCLATAAPVREDAHVVAVRRRAPQVRRSFRAPLRYLDLASLLRAWRRAAALVHDLGADVVYANPCRYLQSPAALLAELPPSLYFCDEPRRVDHDPAARGSRNPATKSMYALMYAAERRIDRRALARATRLATNSSFSAREVARAYGRSAEVIPMGVAERFRDCKTREPAHILSVGTLIPSKGHAVAIAAAGLAARPWPVLVVAPREEPGERERLHTLARRSGARLEIRVGISDQELAEAYAAAFATVYMARREPFGLASLEAQAAGCPVIVAAEGGLPETIAEGRGGWAVPRDPAAVAAKLDHLEQPGVRESACAAARRHAADASWTRSAQAVQSILEHLCN